MAGQEQLNLLIDKFIDLWREGQNANLKLETSGGEAHVTLDVGLGQVGHAPVVLGPPQHYSGVEGAALFRRHQEKNLREWCMQLEKQKVRERSSIK